MEEDNGKQRQDPPDDATSAREPHGASREPENSSGGGTISLTYSELVDYVSEKAADKLSTELKQQEEKRQARTNLILALVGVVGFSSIVALTNIVIRNIVREEIQQASETEKANLLYETKYQTFITSALPLIDKQDDIDQDKMVDTLKHLGSSLDSLKERNEFPIYLNAALEDLWAQDKQQSMDILEPLYEPIVSDNADLAALMLRFYGETVVGSVYPSQDHISKLNKYINMTKDLDVYPEFALLYRALHELQNTGFQRNRKTDQIVQDMKRLKDGDRERLDKRIRFYSTCDWWSCRGEAVRVTETVNSFVSLYPDIAPKEEPDNQNQQGSQ